MWEVKGKELEVVLVLSFTLLRKSSLIPKTSYKHSKRGKNHPEVQYIKSSLTRVQVYLRRAWCTILGTVLAAKAVSTYVLETHLILNIH